MSRSILPHQHVYRSVVVKLWHCDIWRGVEADYKTPNKSSPLDVLPTSLLKSCADIFAPITAHLANLSFEQGRFPTKFKLAQVLPLLKKAGADRSQPVNYRPISNLSTVSKLIERLALCRLRPHLLSSGNFNPLQSAYRNGHSTETALLCVLDNIYKSIDSLQLTTVVCLDISAAFDTISHSTLLQRLCEAVSYTHLTLPTILRV